MKKLIIASLSILLAFILTACGPDDVVTLTPPTFSHVIVEEREPEVEGTLSPYIVNKQDTIKVEVFLNNPSNFQINTITINQTTYRTNRFDDESTNQRIVLFLSVGQITGLTRYAVQRIEYIDENQAVEGFDVTENNEYDIFVLKSLPSASIASSTITTDRLNFDINLIDIDGVIVADSAVAVLYNGSTEIARQDLTAGVNALVFEDLLSNETYSLSVHVDYDLEDGSGVVEAFFLIEEATFTTLEKASPTASISNITTNESTITFDVTFSDEQNVLASSGLHAVLLRDGAVIETKVLALDSLTDVSFSGLLNNNDYTIEIRADYDLNDTIGLREDVLLANATASTEAREIPSLNASIISVSDSRLVLNIDASDLVLGGVVDLNTLEAILYNNQTDTVLSTAYLLDGQLIFETENLRSNTEIRIEIEADYDLQDGQGIQRDTIYLDIFNTAALSIPTASISTMTLTQNAVSFATTLNDPSQTAVEGSFIAELYENDQFVRSMVLPNQSGTYTFDNVPVIYENNYTVKLYIDYDLRDGFGVNEDNALFTYSKISATPKIPALTIDDFVENLNSFSVEYSLYDNDSTLESLSLHIGDTVYTLDPTESTFVIPSFLYNHSYEVKVFATYDLRDGGGVKSALLYETTWTTRALATPSVDLSIINTLQETINFDLTLNDVDSVATIDSIALYEGETLIESLTDLSLRTFEALHSNKNYTLVVTVSYDLLDGEGTQVLVESINATTLENGAPTVSVEIDDIAQESIDFIVNYVDDDNVGVITAIDLYDGETFVESLVDLDLRTFTNLLSSKDYTIKVTVTYDLNDGTGVKTIEALASATTLEKVAPTLDLTIDTVDQESIDFLITLTDIDNVGSVTAIELYNGDVFVESLVDLNVRTFASLLSNNDYTIKVTVTYDLNDGEGNQTLTQEVSTTTLEKAAPTLDLTIDTVTQESIDFLITLTDVDNVGAITSIELYDGDAFVESLVDLNLRTFASLLSNNAYTIKVTVTYDLNDGEGNQTFTQEVSTTTLAKAAPTLDLTIDSENQESIDFLITLTDVDNVGSVTTIELYDGSTLVESLVDLNLRSFASLLSNNDYTIKVTVTFDLNDGEGNQTFTQEVSATTLAKAAPSAIITPTLTPGQIVFDIVITDLDTVMLDGTIDLIIYDDEDNVLETIAVNKVITEYIYETFRQGETLRYELRSDVDLNEGSIVDTLIESGNAVIDTYIEINGNATKDAINLTMDLTQYDTIIDWDTLIIKARYPELDEVIVSGHIASQTFKYDLINLLSDQEVEITIEADYDLGSGVKNGVIYTYTISTLAQVTPTGTVSVIEFTPTTIVATISITDPDTLIIPGTTKIHLYYETTNGVMELQDTLIYTADGDYTFTGLNVENRKYYMVTIETDYYLEDGRDPIESDDLDADYVKADIELLAPTAFISNLVHSVGSVSFDVTINDYLNTIIDGTTYVELVQGGLVVDSIVVTDFNTTSYNFDTLLNNTSYTIRVVTDYDLEDAYPYLDQILTSTLTSYDATPTLTINGGSVVTSVGSIAVDVTVSDADSVIVNSYAVLYLLGVEQARVALTTGTQTVTFNTLLNNTNYSIELIADLDYAEGSIQEDVSFDDLDFTSLDASPSAMLSNITTNLTSFDFKLTVTDTESVITSQSFTIKILDESSVQVGVDILTEDLSQIYLYGLLTNHDYTIEVYATTDYLDGQGSLSRLIHTEVISTDSYTYPSVTIDTIVTSEVDVTFNATLNDPDNLGNLVEINLYKDSVLINTILPTDPYTFTSLLSNTTYEIEVVYSYDALDGLGTVTKTEKTPFTTDAYTAQTIDINITDVDYAEAMFNLVNTDPDSRNTSLTIELLLDGVVVETFVGAGPYNPTGLFSNTTYEIKVSYTYTLNDGFDPYEMIETLEFTTDAYVAPTGSLSNLVITGDDLSVDIDALINPDSIATTLTLSLYEGETLIESRSVTAGTTETFIDVITSSGPYKVVLTATYDLNDQVTNTDVVLDTKAFTFA